MNLRSPGARIRSACASMLLLATVAAILLLQERGQLRVEDDITKYLPDFPTHGSPTPPAP